MAAETAGGTPCERRLSQPVVVQLDARALEEATSRAGTPARATGEVVQRETAPAIEDLRSRAVDVVTARVATVEAPAVVAVREAITVAAQTAAAGRDDVRVV